MMDFQNWQLNEQNKEAKKYSEMISAQARKLNKELLQATTDEQKNAAVYNFYRKYYTLTLTKKGQQAGINNSPSRDIILDYPWKALNLNRITCLKIWEKINH